MCISTFTFYYLTYLIPVTYFFPIAPYTSSRLLSVHTRTHSRIYFTRLHAQSTSHGLRPLTSGLLTSYLATPTLSPRASLEYTRSPVSASSSAATCRPQPLRTPSLRKHSD